MRPTLACAVALGAALLTWAPAVSATDVDSRADKRLAPPTSVMGVAGDGQVRVTWRVPKKTKKARISRFVVTSQPEGKTCTAGRTANSCTVRGLTNGTPYTFTVRVHAKGGRSSTSKPSAPVTPQKGDGAPTSVAAVAGDGQVAVTWSAPASTAGLSISSYTATSTPGGTTCSFYAGSYGGLRCVVTGLTNGTSYTFTVTANYSDGTAKMSVSSAPVTPAPTTSGVIAWGTSYSGMTSVPPEVQSEGVTHLAASESYALAIKDGAVIEWGTRRCSATLPEELQSDVTAIATQADIALAVKGGRVIAWGCNDGGEGTVPAEAQSGVTAVAAGWGRSRFALALKDGRVLAWGSNAHGQTDVPAEAQSGVTDIAAGDSFALALKDGRVLAWGQDHVGQTNVPPQALSGVTAIAAGPSYALALKDGGVIAWGDNWWGQIDVPGAAAADVTSIAAGGLYAAAIRDGQVVVWGTSLVGKEPLPPQAESGLVAAIPGQSEWALLLKQ